MTCLWEQYWGDPTITRRNLLVVEHLDVIGKVLSRLPQDVAHQLTGAAAVGLIRAVETFQPEYGIPFPRYAWIKVLSAVRDGGRRDDLIPRSARESVNAYRRARENGAGEDEAYRAAAAHTNRPEWFVRQRVTPALNILDRVSLDAPTQWDHPSTVDDGDLRILLRDHLGRLPERERACLFLAYYEDWPLRDIGVLFGVSESRVSQINQGGLRMLRESLAAEDILTVEGCA